MEQMPTVSPLRPASRCLLSFLTYRTSGQPIRLQLLSGRGGPSSRNPFDHAVRPLEERVSMPGGRARSHSPASRYTQEDAVRKGIDRYVPGQGSRSRSPAPRRRGGRRPGARREGGGRDQDNGRGGEGGRGGRSNARSKKTQEELDAEMEDYFGGGGGGGGGDTDQAPANGTTTAAGTDGTGQNTAVPATEDVDMIE